MNTDELNISLAELETNLRNLKSAREQVEIVTESSAGLTRSTEKLLHEIGEISNKLDKDSAVNIKILSATLDDFKNKHEVLFNKREEKVLENIKDFNIVTTDLKSSLENTFAKIKVLNTKQTTDFNTELNTILSDNKNHVNDNIDDFKHDTNELKDSLKKTLYEIADSNKQQLSDFKNELDNALAGNIDTIKSNIEGFSNSTTQLKSVTEDKINEFKTLSTKTINKQAIDVSKTLETLKEISKAQSTSIQVFQKNIDEKFQQTDNKLKDLNKKQNIFSIVILILLFIGFLYLALK